MIKITFAMQAGRITADSSIGRMLFDVVASVPTIDPEQFELMVTSGMEVHTHGRVITRICLHSVCV